MVEGFDDKNPDGQNPQNGNARFASACPMCGTEYAPEEARVVSEKEGAFLIHTNCKKCRCSVVATLVANQMGVSSVGLITDLTYEDVIKFKDGSDITADDILRVYTVLSEDNRIEKALKV
ncbi:hypothetical protein KKH43_00980 [Patescibacteria group bacterium]|nr:hypothetical protein [Patescibacteria group bacterium]